MAKKKAGKKPAAKKAKAARASLKKNARPGVKKALANKGRWTAPGAKARATAAKTATRAPKQEPLIKGLRIKSLDNVCGHISDTRAAIARLQGEEADLERQAHQLMVKHDQMTWQASGHLIVLVRIPGEEKLTVKTVRSRGPAPAAEPEGETAPADAQTPERAAAVNEANDNAGGEDVGDQE